MKGLHGTEFVLLIIGGLNWGLIGLGGFAGSDWNVVNKLLGGWPQVEWIVYVLVGLAALHLGFTHKGDCRTCGSGGMM